MKQKRKLVHQLNYERGKGEVYTMPSKSVPDMAMTPREIMQRYSQGMPLDQSRNLVYTGDQDLPDIRTMDLVDIQEMSEANDAYIKAKQAELDNKVKQRRQAKQKQLQERTKYEEANKVADDKPDPKV